MTQDQIMSLVDDFSDAVADYVASDYVLASDNTDLNTRAIRTRAAVVAAIEALQPNTQEPVAWGMEKNGLMLDIICPEEHEAHEGGYTVPLYSHPAPQAKPLTVQEVEQILAQHNYEIHGDRARYIVRMTELAHNIGVKP